MYPADTVKSGTKALLAKRLLFVAALGSLLGGFEIGAGAKGKLVETPRLG